MHAGKHIFQWEELLHLKQASRHDALWECNPPGVPLTNFSDWGEGEGPTEVIFYNQKNQNLRICLPKKITPCFSIP